jgi:glycerol kinase
VTETTALGAASLAGLAAGVYRGTDDLAAQWRVDRVFEPATDRDEAMRRVQGWEHAVTQLRSGCAEPAGFIG